MTAPLFLYSATVSYRTPSGRRVLYGSVVAAPNRSECAARLRRRLSDEMRYGRRRIAAVLDDFSVVRFGRQIAARRRAALRRS